MLTFLIELKELLIIALNAIRANKMRSILTTLGIIIGIVAVTTMSTAIVGLKQSFINSISSLGSDVLYIDKFPWFSRGDWSLYRNRKDITYKQYEKLKEIFKDYKAMAPNKRTFGLYVKYEGRSAQSTQVTGTTQDYVRTSNIIPEEGRFFSEFESDAGRKVCLIGQDIKDELFPSISPLNKEIKVNNVPFKVIGVIEKQGSGFLGSASQDGQIIMPLKAFETTVGSARNRLRIDVKVKNVADMENAKEELTAAMRTIRKVPPGEPDDFAINQQEAIKEVYDSTVGVVAIAGIAITALALFVGAIGIMNIMFVSVTERTREIGIRKAIGARRISILLQFLIEAAIICIIGGIIGILISIPLSLIINQFFPTEMPVTVVLIAILISALVGIISGILPALRASKLDPVDSLRYE